MKNKYGEAVTEMMTSTAKALCTVEEIDRDLRMALFSEVERRREVNAEQVRLFKKVLGR